MSASTTIAHLKISISAQTGVPPCEQRLIYNGRALVDQETIETAGIPNGATIYLVVLIRGGGSTWYRMDDSLLDPRYDYDLTHLDDAGKTFTRGGYPYQRPCGWRRFALKVLGQTKYSDDNWIAEGESGWPVSYHGTSLDCAQHIARDGFKIGPRAVYGIGVYTSPSIEMVGKCYSKTFQSDGKTYKVALQNRVNPDINGGHLKIVAQSGTDLWVHPKQDSETGVHDVRPYGILVRMCD